MSGIVHFVTADSATLAGVSVNETRLSLSANEVGVTFGMGMHHYTSVYDYLPLRCGPGFQGLQSVVS